MREAVRAALGKPRATQPASLQVLMWETVRTVRFLCAQHVGAKGLGWKGNGESRPVRSRNGFGFGFYW